MKYIIGGSFAFTGIVILIYFLPDADGNNLGRTFSVAILPAMLFILFGLGIMALKRK
jgi:hypothetical protein